LRDITKFTQSDWETATEEEVSRGYQEKAADEEREKEALEWADALIGDAWEEGADAEVLRHQGA
jgi:hypothetical protein